MRILRSRRTIIEKLHHIAVTVTDVPAAVRWYKEHFDLIVNYADDTWASLQFENIALALIKPEQHPRHIAVERSNAKNFGPLTRHRDGTASTYIIDPWGNTVEILDSKIQTAIK